MENSFSALDADALKALYEKESNELHAKLLDGTSWNELRGQRKKVTKLAVALHKKIHRAVTMNPAESPSSDMEGRLTS
jgi:hypothetical protein